MILAILQARMSSTRLPGKVMRPLLGQPMIGRQIERLRRATSPDDLIVATSIEASDDPLAAYCATLEVEVCRGPLNDVLARFHAAAAPRRPDHVMRLTADCPLTDPTVIDACARLHLDSGADYTSNSVTRSFPIGLDVELMTFAALETAHREASAPTEREHVTPYLYNHPERFRVNQLVDDVDRARLRWTVDTPEDFAFVERVYSALHPAKPGFDRHDILAWQAGDADA